MNRAMGYYEHSKRRRVPLKKIIFVMLLILVGVGAFFAWKMLKGDGGCCGWGGDNTDPWSSYTPPARGGGVARSVLLVWRTATLQCRLSSGWATRCPHGVL
jgi:hypothetical protein